MTRWMLLLVAASAACLSTPGPASSDDDVDAPPRSCRRDARPAGQTWPPPDVAVHEARVADIDRDGIGDLVVSVAPVPPAITGASRVYVLYGPVSPTAPEWHAVLDLDDDQIDAEIQASGLSLDDLDGDGCLDLTVAGPPTAGASQHRVAVWRHGGGAVPWSGPAVSAQLDRDLEPDGPVTVVWGDVSGEAAPDLFVSDLFRLHVLSGSTVTALGNPMEVPFAPCAGWDNIEALAVQPGPTRDRLVVMQTYRTNTLDIDDGGGFLVGGMCMNDTDFPQLRGTAPVALDSSAPLDLVAGATADVGARLLTGDALFIPMTGARACGPTPRGGVPEPYIEGIAAGDLGGTAAPDVVLIDYDGEETPTPGTYACLMNAVTVNVGENRVEVNGVDEVRIADGRLRYVVIGDAGGGPRVWIFALDGVIHCRRRGGTSVLVPC